MNPKLLPIKEALEKCLVDLAIISKDNSDLMERAKTVNERGQVYLTKKPSEKVIKRDELKLIELDRWDYPKQIKQGYKYLAIKPGTIYIDEVSCQETMNQADVAAQVIKSLLQGEDDDKPDQAELDKKALLFLVDYETKVPRLIYVECLMDLIYTNRERNTIRPEIKEVYKDISGKDLDKDLVLRAYLKKVKSFASRDSRQP